MPSSQRFHMINEAVECQEGAAVKHSLVSKRAETWSCAIAMLYAYSRVTIKPWVGVMWHRVITNLGQKQTVGGFLSSAWVSTKKKTSFHSGSHWT